MNHSRINRMMSDVDGENENENELNEEKEMNEKNVEPRMCLSCPIRI